MTNFTPIAEGAVAFLAIVGVIWRVSKSESNIYFAIDALKDGIQDRLGRIEQTISLQQMSLENRSEVFDYRLEILQEKFNARIERLNEGLTEVRGFLQRQGDYSCRGSCDIEEGRK